MADQRVRLIVAAARVFAGEASPSVAAVAKVARVSRNTFYEYFDDLEHARAAGKLRAQQRLVTALHTAEQRARTPIERWRELAQAWIGWALESPAESLLILAGQTGALSAGGRELEGAFTRSLELVRALGPSAQNQSATRVTAVAAASEALVRALIEEQWRTTAATSNASARHELERALVDIAARLLR